jgi:hypothetical protein
MADVQNPGGPAGASLIDIENGLQSSSMPFDRQAQLIAKRFALSPWTARAVASLCFAGCGHD